MHILVSNDDGYSSAGIQSLAEQLKSIADVTVVAPDRNRSAASHSLTLNRALHARRIEDNVYAVDGTPTDCVHLAVSGMLEENTPDMVVAGINVGQNMGDDVLYSGTVAAATEGRSLGFPAIAFSLATDGIGDVHWDAAASIATRIVSQLTEKPLPPETILNINIPNLPLAEIAGMKVTRLGSRHRSEPVFKDVDAKGKPIYWVGAAGPEHDAGEGTDFHAVRQGFVSITPLNIDLTDHEVLKALEGWLEGTQ